MGQRILVVDDDKEIVRILRAYLEKAGFTVLVAYEGETALHSVRSDRPDLVVLDLMLPDRDGWSITRVVREDPALTATPIIMLTARVESDDKIKGLNLGADDYIPKPFSPKVVVARVRSMLRRKHKSTVEDDKATVKAKDLVIHPGRHEVLVKGKSVELTFTEFRLLHLLARRPGWVFSRQQIVDGVRGEDYPVTERAVDVQIVGLRKKLGPCGPYIETVRGVGYRFRD